MSLYQIKTYNLSNSFLHTLLYSFLNKSFLMTLNLMQNLWYWYKIILLLAYGYFLANGIFITKTIKNLSIYPNIKTISTNSL